MDTSNTPPLGEDATQTAITHTTPMWRVRTGLVLALLIVAVLVGIAGIIALRHSQDTSPMEPTADIAPQPALDTIRDTMQPLSSPAIEAPSDRVGKILDLPYIGPVVTIAPGLSADFSVDEIQNIDDMERAYGVTFSEEDLAQLQQRKFLVKNLLDTNLSPVRGFGHMSDYGREVPLLYNTVSGADKYMERTQANSVFYTSDAIMHLFSILSVELLKETENGKLFPLVRDVTSALYKAATQRVESSTGEAQAEWITIRNYLAVPYALLSTVAKPPSPEDFMESRYQYEDAYQTFMEETDKEADTLEQVTAFVNTLGLDEASTKLILADLTHIYEAPAKANVNVLKDDMSNNSVSLEVPFSLFTVRGSYTGNSLRRQYFRAVQWYQQVPFYLKSDTNTRQALRLTELMQDVPQLMEQYTLLSDLLTLLVGPSDDLDARDYVAALESLGDNAYTNLDATRRFLTERRPPSLIKGMPAEYDTMYEVNEADVLDATRGMRFFSQKFIPDSYWTGEMTQGDEAPAVDGKYRLPAMASSLEVMTILGSNAAREALPQLDFYNDEYKPGIDIQLERLSEEANGWDETYWRSNQVTGILWTINGLFTWYKERREQLPQFMQSPLWSTKTLLTGSGFWTEMRHTNILYAKQSFAEMGGGDGDSCEDVPEPARGYIEPQPEAYARLLHTAKMLDAAYKGLGISLKNRDQLETYIELLEKMQEYTTLQLGNTQFTEETDEVDIKYAENSPCTAKRLVEGSESPWEDIRTGLTNLMLEAQPRPIDGPVLTAKDKRAAVIADVHTAYGSTYLEEGTGVPRVIFVAVKDANGPRLTIGFTYSHYEFTSNTRLTDEAWQANFYEGNPDDIYGALEHKPKETWPTLPTWYHELLGER